MKIGIVGSGNVAFHLAKGLKDSNHQIAYILGRNEIIGRDLSSQVSTDFVLEVPDERVDLVLVCVNDDAIIEVIKYFPEEQRIAYTSGTLNLAFVKKQVKNEVGVFYPLQSFSKDRTINLFEVPFLIEASEDDYAKLLFDLAWSISRQVQYCSSEQRKYYHVAAVLVNNFTNHLLYLGKEIVEEQHLNFEILYPLIQETIKKAIDLTPHTAQTGPARRKDLKTIEEHQLLLDGSTKDIYHALTESILKLYHK